MNKIIIKGRLTRDPELKTSASGIEVCKFSVAVDRRRQKDKDQQTDFFDCTAFGNTGAAIAKYIVKAQRNRKKWVCSQGLKQPKVTVSEVDNFEFCGSKGDGAGSAPAEVDAASGMEKVSTEELPF